VARTHSSDSNSFSVSEREFFKETSFILGGLVIFPALDRRWPAPRPELFPSLNLLSRTFVCVGRALMPSLFSRFLLFSLREGRPFLGIQTFFFAVSLFLSAPVFYMGASKLFSSPRLPSFASRSSRSQFFPFYPRLLLARHRPPSDV